MDRRKFLSLFASGSVGLVAAEKAGLFADMWTWAFGPQKTILIPAAPKIWLPEAEDAALALEGVMENIPKLLTMELTYAQLQDGTERVVWREAKIRQAEGREGAGARLRGTGSWSEGSAG